MKGEEKTYQPGWGEKKEKHHHHHHSHHSTNNRMGGSLRMRDKQAYIGLMVILAAVLGVGAYKVIKMFADEWRAMPHDDPATEMKVDELRIHKVDEQDALLLGDSLAQAYNVDSLRRTVQIETRPVYRPPRREDKWYITKREWKKIWADWKVMRWEKKHEGGQNDQEKTAKEE